MDIFLNRLELAAAVVLTATLAATPAVIAQSPKGDPAKPQPAAAAQQQPQQQVHIVQHDTIVGASVTNGLEGEGQVTLGTISDLVLDGRKGHVCHAVLSSGGALGIASRQAPVAWDALTWDAENSQFTLSMTAEELERIPEFDPENLDRLGRADAPNDRDQANARDTGAVTNPGSARVIDTAAAREPDPSYMLVSNIGDCDVLAGKAELGDGETLYVEPVSGCVAFISISSGGVVGIGETSYVVPWAALSIVPKVEDPEEPAEEREYQIQIGKSEKQLEAAPKLSDEGADVNQMAFREKVYKFYGVERPKFESKKADQTGQEPVRDGGETTRRQPL